MEKYYKIEEGKEIFFKGKILQVGNEIIVNPTEEQILAAGWQVYVEPEPTTEELLARAKNEKLMQIWAYDSSSDVEEFTINGIPMWLGHELRLQIKTSADAYEALGYENMSKVFNGAEFTFPIALWKLMLNSLEIYAAESLNVTERHKNNVKNLNTILEVLDYDITSGYPEKLTFNT